MGLSLMRNLMIVTMAVSISFTIILTPNKSQAEAVTYRIYAVLVDSPTGSGPEWPNDTCAYQAGLPGTTAQMDVVIDEPIISSTGLMCDPNCSIPDVVLGYSIRFNSNEDCKLDDSMLTHYKGLEVIDSPQGSPLGDGYINPVLLTSHQCLNETDPTSWDSTCQFFGMAGDPQDSFQLYIWISLFTATDPTATWFDSLPSPAYLPDLLDDTLIQPARIRFSVWDPISQYELINTYEVVDVTLLRDPSSLIIDLIDATSEVNASSGIVNSLDAKLDSAVDALMDARDNNDVSAVNKLEAFKNAVEAQRGNHISEDDADSLIATAQEIIDMLSVQ